MRLPLEDECHDILSKAANGLKLTSENLERATGLDRDEIRLALRGKAGLDTLRALADALSLNAEALLAIARSRWHPDPADLKGVHCITTPFGSELSVNAWIVSDPDSSRTIIFDTGTNARPLLNWVKRQSLEVEAIFITHTHSDHIAELPALRDAYKCPVYTSEPLPGAIGIHHGYRQTIGALELSARLTWGHSESGLSYVVDGLEKPLVVVGDALFAGSMGGGKVDYGAALQTTREQILSLPPETVVCPGHGPATTVGQELAHNPFFA